jgi:hypothetical protein
MMKRTGACRRGLLTVSCLHSREEGILLAKHGKCPYCLIIDVELSEKRGLLASGVDNT